MVICVTVEENSQQPEINQLAPKLCTFISILLSKSQLTCCFIVICFRGLSAVVQGLEVGNKRFHTGHHKIKLQPHINNQFIGVKGSFNQYRKTTWTKGLQIHSVLLTTFKPEVVIIKCSACNQARN